MAIDKVEKFAAVINKTADKKVKQIESQAKEFLEREVHDLEAEFEKKLENRLSFESDRIKSVSNKEVTALQNGAKKAISEKRIGIRREVFNDVKMRLLSFISSEEYRSFLEKSIDMIKSHFGDDVIIYAKESDVELVKEIAEGSEVKCSDNILIGGVYASDKAKAYFIYDTLDSRLDTQYDNFLSVADLSV